MDVIQNFDWGITNRKICIFMPSYFTKEHTLFSISQIKTVVPQEDYVIIIGDDSGQDHFDGLESQNVFYFSLQRNGSKMRNGCFIRNYAIKRCQSDLFFQKDGEVVVLGDFIKNCIEWSSPWRAGNIYVLNEQQTKQYKTDNLLNCCPVGIQPNSLQDTEDVRKNIFDSHGKINVSTYFHYAYCISMKYLQNINGYNEQYWYYGYEDSDLYCRAFKDGYKIMPDYSCSAIHLYHSKSQINHQMISQMEQIFINSDLDNTARNQNILWGEGGDDN